MVHLLKFVPNDYHQTFIAVAIWLSGPMQLWINSLTCGDSWSRSLDQISALSIFVSAKRNSREKIRSAISLIIFGSYKKMLYLSAANCSLKCLEEVTNLIFGAAQLE